MWISQGGGDMADKIRLGLIGASVKGTWSARSHLPAVQASSDVELTAVCTTKADSAEAARRAYGARLAFDDYRKMVASPEIDAVAVVVRVPSHYAPTKAALEAGKPLHCGWPPRPTTAEAGGPAAPGQANGGGRPGRPAGQRQPGRPGVGAYRRHPIRRQRLSHGNLRERRDAGRVGRGLPAIERGDPLRSEERQPPRADPGAAAF